MFHLSETAAVTLVPDGGNMEQDHLTMYPRLCASALLSPLFCPKFSKDTFCVMHIIFFPLSEKRQGVSNGDSVTLRQ